MRTLNDLVTKSRIAHKGIQFGKPRHRVPLVSQNVESVPSKRLGRIHRERVDLQHVIAIGVVLIIDRFPLRVGSLQRPLPRDVREDVVVDAVAGELDLTR